MKIRSTEQQRSVLQTVMYCRHISTT